MTILTTLNYLEKTEQNIQPQKKTYPSPKQKLGFFHKVPLNRISHIAATAPTDKAMNYCKASSKYKLFPSSHAVQQRFSGWDFSGMKSEILSFVEKEITTSKASKEHGFQCKGLHQPPKQAKRNAATEEFEERGKYCQRVAEPRGGGIWPRQAKTILIPLQEDLCDLPGLTHI